MTTLGRPTRLLALLALLLSSTLAFAGGVLKIVVDGTIHPITDEYIGRAIADAERNHDEALLIELRTPGGLVDSTRSIVEKILASRVPVIIHVAPSGSRAASAGFFLLESADVAAMAPGTNTGAAHPVLLFMKVDDVMKQKMENDAAAFLRSYVSKRGRNVRLAESAVRESKSWTDQEALAQNLIDIVSPNTEDLLKQLEGREITRFDGAKVTVRTAGKPVRDFDMTLRQKVLTELLDPNIAFALFVIGLLLVFIEFQSPGTIVPGVVGVVLILTSVFAFRLLPLHYSGAVLIALAIVLFVLEAKFASHGLLGLGGTACMVLGALLLVDAPIPEMRVKLFTALAVSIPFGLISVFLTTLVLKAHRQKAVTGEEGLAGEVGVARTPLQPEGKVFVHGELWDAVSSVPVAAGEAVQVRSVEGLRLRVDPVSAAQPLHPVAS